VSRMWGTPWTILSLIVVTIFAGGYAAPASAQGVDGSTTMITIDAPAQGQTVRIGEEIGIGGWAVDVAAPGGVDAIEVYLDGKRDEGGTLLGQAAYGKARSDVATALNSTAFTNVGFDLTWKVSGSNGDHTAYVYVHSTNGWNYVTVSFRMSNTAPAPSTQASTGSQGFSSTGSGSTFGTGQTTSNQQGTQPWGQYVAGMTPANAAQSAAMASSTNPAMGQAFATAQGALGYGQNYGVGSAQGTQYGTGSAYATGYPYSNNAYNTGYPNTSSAYGTGYPYSGSAYNTGYPYSGSAYNTGYPYSGSAYNTGYPYSGSAYNTGYPYSGSAYNTGYPYSGSAYNTGYPYSGSAYNTGYTGALGSPYATGGLYGSNTYGYGAVNPYSTYGYGAVNPYSTYGYGAVNPYSTYGYGATNPYAGYGYGTGYGSLGYTPYQYGGYTGYQGYYPGYTGTNNGLGY